MRIKEALSLPFAMFVRSKIKRWDKNAIALQSKTMHYLLREAETTTFGKDHAFGEIKDYSDFKKSIPVRDYEDLKPYIERIKLGEKDVLWKGLPIYFAKTSGTTSGAKYIPISKESMPEHIKATRNALLLYIADTKKAHFVSGKMIFLQGSPEMEQMGEIKVGRLSGIVAHHVPKYLQKNRLPSYKTNCIDDWEMKVDAIVKETLKEDMRLISGIPPWVQMYFDKIQELTGKKIKEVFPDFSLFVHGGVNFEPYRKKLEESIGKRIDSLETYPASEGFIAFQDGAENKGLLLNVDGGIFFEFIPTEHYFDENPERVWLKDIELNKNYALILNTSAGLWGYSIGDTVKFVNKNPYRIVVTGRIKHYISAFGEHVIAEEVEDALQKTCEELNVQVVEFTLAPQVNPEDSTLPYHEWFIEFREGEIDLEKFTSTLNQRMMEKNVYYKDLIEGKILQKLVVRKIRKNGFIDYMKSEGKLGGQNKLPRLSNDRKIAEKLSPFIIQ